eukprot:m.163045 g.163045  ORF g.163045 m.163045 type:complete len:493 (+) comp12265_c0_seq1:122-1600(+)
MRRHMRALAAPAVVFCCSLLIQPAETAVSTLRTRLGPDRSQTLHMFDESMFGFNAGGTASIAASCENRLETLPFTFVILTSEQAEAVSIDGHTDCNLAFRHVRAVSPANRNEVTLNYTVVFGNDLETGFYRFGLLLCLAGALPNDCEATLTLLNPGGEHLSSDQMDLPNIFNAFLIFWGVVVGLHLVNWVTYFQYRNNLHDAVLVAPILAAISARLNRDAWEAASNDEDNSALLKEGLVAAYAALCYSFLLIMLITDGYCILRPTLDQGRGEGTIGLAVAVFVSMVCMLYIHRYFLAFTVVSLIATGIIILKNAAKNILALRMRLLEIEDSAGPQLGTVAEFAAPLLSKRFMIASARFTFITYTVLWSIEGAIDNALEKQRDMQVVLEEVLVVYLIVSIMWVTRLRNFERFVQPHDERRREAEAEATELRRPPCDVVQLPGEKLCLGVQATETQLINFLDGLRRKEKYDAERPLSTAPTDNDDAQGNGEENG